jgi:uncharacterized coiled-coil protein SlyX
MKTTAFVLSLTSALLLFGCDRATPGGGGVDKRVADLEKQVAGLQEQVAGLQEQVAGLQEQFAGLQEQNRDVRAKLRAAHSFGRSPLEDLFASPEFWQCTYDSSWADCSNRCSKQTSDGYQACLTKPEGPERVQCINENTATGQACLQACPVQTSPTDPPECRGGGIG